MIPNITARFWESLSSQWQQESHAILLKIPFNFFTEVVQGSKSAFKFSLNINRR